jgi:hypothetical protein
MTTERAGERRRLVLGARRPTLTRGLFIAGLALFAVLLWRVGLASIVDVLAPMGWSALLVPVPHALYALGETAGWRLAFSRGRCPLSYVGLLRLTVAVKLIQGVTPSVSQAAELVRIHLLRQAGVQPDVAAASVVMAKTTTTAAELAFIVAGVGALIGSVAMDRAAAMSAFAGIAALGVLLGGLLAWQWLGLSRPLVWLGARLALVRPFLARHGALLSSTDRLLRQYLSAHRGRFLASGLLFFVTWTLSVLETYVFLWILDVPTTAVDAWLIQAWLAVVVRVTAFVPNHVGTLEAGAVMAFAFVGQPAPTALAFAFLRRARQLAWMGAALAAFPRAARRPAAGTPVEPSSRLPR